MRELLHDHFDDEFATRFIGFAKNGIVRIPLDALGPFYKCCADGHEKLNEQALEMGELNFGIYGAKDGYSSLCMALVVMPNVRSEQAIAHFFLDMTEAYDCEWNMRYHFLQGVDGIFFRSHPPSTNDG